MHPLFRILGFFVLLFTAIVFFVFVVRLVIYFFKRTRFPRKTLVSALTGLIVFSGIFVYLQYFFSFDAIDRSHKQEGPATSSPAGQYTANAYYEPYGGAAGGVNVWIEVTDHAENATRTIYYADAKQQFSLNWIDEETLSVTNADEYPDSDRSAVLKVRKEIYDENGLACKSLLMKNDYEECYRYEKR
ncbi:DUF5412 family protein [Saccharibacillus alkalitolerans]|uniref:DUF5412 domain-containing protein n=1 Tax=Saccharibacillus alkalitolerans TaxID=2705290 RepID=A0ABX0F6R7_9BACL|nr:DUF5412 family protein [Saccharibacillus alkalitolerans]NGZ76658.1 DUF5412 domain-containing protein [Saccharibacillus alkalitolerans]